ncbi:MAG: glycosyltransferase [Bacteroidota bacterium]|jgi:cellulose synthase/poly-beta-1,6-N-acetylglucosamine synthase-like glycosyltransferase|nr:glycosyltransferase family 2 protein [Ignavibacteria bacterium]MCU7520426.1 glycosyltransferase family 2 protein [Ignavibacteria bacterium]
MSVLEVDLSFLFVVAVILIWFMIGYQFILTVYGYFNYMKSLKEKKEVDAKEYDLPSCTILIPAHNEDKVIGQTIEAMLRLNYPKDKLEIIVINDGSKDRTKEIIQHYASLDSRVVLFDVPKGEGGKGKSRALNLGIRQAKNDIIAIYDADNTPDANALRYLVIQLTTHKDLGAVLGKFRTVNKNTNLLTKFINIETLSFQSMLQAGRWQMHRIATLPGTNFVMWKWLIYKLGGWDEEALTEDSELSIRIYQEGYKIKFIPYSITYEQEPQEWKVWIKQRMRWVRGNNYVIAKFFKQIPKFKNKRLAFDLLYNLSLYYVFFAAILISDVLFIISALNLVSIALPGPYTFVWIMAFFLFILEITLAISFDEEESIKNIFLIVLSYFSYCQLWIYIVVKAIYSEYIKREKRTWDKTVRFEVKPSQITQPQVETTKKELKDELQSK